MKISYRPEIDGLRAVAVLAVLGFHTFPDILPGGFVGVDIFFVISGFLITSILVGEMEDHRFSIVGFYARRVLRIFPALIVVLLFCLIFGWHVLIADEYKSLGKHIAAAAGFVSNIILWSEVGYFDRSAELKPLLHLWSLGIEEQFYMIWPLLLGILWKTGRHRLMLVCILFSLSLIGSSWVVWSDHNQAFYSPLLRAWELLAGALIAMGAQQPLFLQSNSWRNWGPSLAILALALCFIFWQPGLLFPGPFALIPIGASALLIASCDSGNRQWIYFLLTSRPMVFVGLISYPLYLWHWPLLSFARILEGGQPSPQTRLSMLLLSAALATLTYMGIERPIKRLPRRLAIILLVTLMIASGSVGINIYRRDGLESVRHKRIIQLSANVSEDFTDFEKRGLIKEGHCELPFIFPDHTKREICLTSNPDTPYTAVVMGDSHAVHAFWGLASAFEKIHQNLRVVGRGACVPFLGYTSPNNPYQCQPQIDEILGAITKSDHIRSVVFVFRGRYINSNNSSAEVEDFKNAMTATLQMLTGSNKKLYIFLPIVEPGFDPRLCAGSLPLGRRPPKSCEIDQEQDRIKAHTINTALRQVLLKFPDAVLFDPNQFICSEGKCALIQQGHSIFKDDNHLSHFGSQWIGRRFSPRQ